MTLASMRELFPHIPRQAAQDAADIFDQIYTPLLGENPLALWKRHGCWIQYWNGKFRSAFGPRQPYCSLYFQGPQWTELYRSIGGTCPSVKVTIKIPYNQDWDPDPIRYVVAQALNLT